VDILERACLYNLYMKASVIKDLNEEIRSSWAMKDASLLKRRVIRVLCSLEHSLDVICSV
jgi:hypothetical protein